MKLRVKCGGCKFRKRKWMGLCPYRVWLLGSGVPSMGTSRCWVPSGCLGVDREEEA